MPPIDYNPLRNRIRDLGLTQKECAEKIGISEGQLCQKMAGNYEFRQSEISKLCDPVSYTHLTLPTNSLV